MDCTTCYCRMPRCPLFGQVAPRAQFTWHDWHRQAPRWRCRGCRALVSARTGTAYAGIRTGGATYLRGAVALADGVWGTPPRQGTRGRMPKPRRDPPPDLCYAVVVKERAHGRVVHVTTRIVYGTSEQVAAALQASPVSHTINTYGVERNNLTVRQHARRMGRKVNAFSKDKNYLEYQLTLAFAYYHFVVPHRSLRQRLPHPMPTTGYNGSPKKWKPVTPSMAAGLTDHVWTMDEC